ncbi:hypothetical protein [Treponema sp.]|uniref:hypothetical protein n=1 Tax=Treponema sp. TaxID=166 RepID=UPI00388E582F
MKFSFEYLWKCLLSGAVFVPVTLKLALIPLAIALVLGTLIALARILLPQRKARALAIADFASTRCRFFGGCRKCRRRGSGS